MLRAATSTCGAGGLTFALTVTWLEMSWYNATLAPAETRNANIRTDSKRLFMYIYQLQKLQKRGHVDNMPLLKGLTNSYLAASGLRQVVAGGSPNPTDGTPGTQEKRCRRKGDESEQQGVFNEVLPLFFMQ